MSLFPLSEGTTEQVLTMITSTTTASRLPKPPRIGVLFSRLLLPATGSSSLARIAPVCFSPLYVPAPTPPLGCLVGYHIWLCYVISLATDCVIIAHDITAKKGKGNHAAGVFTQPFALGYVSLTFSISSCFSLLLPPLSASFFFWVQFSPVVSF